MDAAEALVAFLTIFFSVFMLGLSVVFMVLVLKFLIKVPSYLKDIADSLYKIANDKGER